VVVLPVVVVVVAALAKAKDLATVLVLLMNAPVPGAPPS
jgi:hypothetical protein